ncbi:hypothetical protein [Rhodopseudomonas palustris]|uniref:hypothetical protein n=1 Tax=Rhodopseudomonas palustris TaxID=1076 RepID=UPI0020CC7188|nr:hypothetical protein [Rhodopseudomonas palustris]
MAIRNARRAQYPRLREDEQNNRENEQTHREDERCILYQPIAAHGDLRKAPVFSGLFATTRKFK